jgi:hypothetical protein
MFALHKSPELSTPAALTLTYTHNRVNADGKLESTTVAVVMLNAPRVTDRHYEIVGRRALDTLAIVRPDLAAVATQTDPLTFARRFAGKRKNLTVHATHCIQTDERADDYRTGPVTLDYTDENGGGSWPATTDVIDTRGLPVTLPAIQYA